MGRHARAGAALGQQRDPAVQGGGHRALQLQHLQSWSYLLSVYSLDTGQLDTHPLDDVGVEVPDDVVGAALLQHRVAVPAPKHVVGGHLKMVRCRYLHSEISTHLDF